MGETSALWSAIDSFHTSTAVDGRNAATSPFSRYDLIALFRPLAALLRLSALALLIVSVMPGHVFAQSSSAADGKVSGSSLMDKTADVVVFVKPLSADTASIGVAYNTIIRHEYVKDDLRRLLNATGWTYRGDLLVQDASSHPDDRKEYPATTGAQLTVTNAPQVRAGAPELLPYLLAFQAFSHVEVNFALPEITPYNGVDRFESKALSVELHKDQGIYRFETEIRDHHNPLPALTAATSDVKDDVKKNDVKLEGAGTVAAPKPAPTRSNWFLGAMAVLGGLLVGVTVYALLGRREHKPVPVRSPQQR